MKRSRGRNRRSGGNQQNAFNNPNRHFESVGPDVKIRGSAQQVLEKYLQYGRDAQTSGDRILSEAYFQYAEHYQRIVAKQQEARMQQQQQHQNRGGGNGPRDERDPRNGQDRDPRGGPGEEALQVEEEDGEAEVLPAMASRRDEDDESDSLRVIDADEDDRDEAASAIPAERAERQPGDGRERGNRRNGRKPYRPREDRPAREPVADAVSETDGVMKTLARGRRRPVTEESPAEQD
ncbi:MAG: DUF4167 domain-containing protein [Hyphomonas sp.]